MIIPLVWSLAPASGIGDAPETWAVPVEPSHPPPKRARQVAAGPKTPVGRPRHHPLPGPPARGKGLPRSSPSSCCGKQPTVTVTSSLRQVEGLLPQVITTLLSLDIYKVSDRVEGDTARWNCFNTTLHTLKFHFQSKTPLKILTHPNQNSKLIPILRHQEILQNSLIIKPYTKAPRNPSKPYRKPRRLPLPASCPRPAARRGTQR